jgi:hypothetical protein
MVILGMLVSSSGCGDRRASDSASSLPAMRQESHCDARSVEIRDWPEVRGSQVPITLRLPPDATRLPLQSRVVRGELWATSSGYVSYVVENWGPQWLDSVAVDFAPSRPVCMDSVAEAGVRVRAFFGRPHPFDEGQYVIAYRELSPGRVLVLQTFARNPGARDTLFAVVRSVRH